MPKAIKATPGRKPLPTPWHLLLVVTSLSVLSGCGEVRIARGDWSKDGRVVYQSPADAQKQQIKGSNKPATELKSASGTANPVPSATPFVNNGEW